MPHVGGGGSSGGGGFSSFEGDSKPRYDHQGRLHSPYYRRPGFYYQGHYVPYQKSQRRGIRTFLRFIVAIFMATVCALVAITIIINKGKYSKSDLQDYGLNQYEEIYDKSNYSTYEYNLLITFVTYDDNQRFDYVCINGDNLDVITDSSFGSDKSTFGKALLSSIPKEGYADNLYSYLATSLTAVISEGESLGSTNLFFTPKTGSPTNSKIINKTSHNFSNGESELKTAINEFYNQRGYNISFLIENNEKVYSVDWWLFGSFVGASALLIYYGIYSIIKTNFAIKVVEKAIQKGKANKYFEGEDPFDVYFKENPLEDSMEKYFTENAMKDPLEDYYKDHPLESKIEQKDDK